MTGEIMSARREKRKGERIWRKSRLVVQLQMFIALCMILKNPIHGKKEQFFKKQISDCGGGVKINYLALLTLCSGAERRHYFHSMMTL